MSSFDDLLGGRAVTAEDAGDGFEIWPEGDYRVKIVDTKPDEQNDKKFFKFDFEDINTKKKASRRFYIHTEGAVKMLRNQLANIGFRDQLTTANIFKLQHKIIDVSVRHREWNEKTQMEIWFKNSELPNAAANIQRGSSEPKKFDGGEDLPF